MVELIGASWVCGVVKGVRAYSYSFTHIRPRGPEMCVGRFVRARLFRRTIRVRVRLFRPWAVAETGLKKWALCWRWLLAMKSWAHSPCNRNRDRDRKSYRYRNGIVVVADTTRLSCRRSLVAHSRAGKVTSAAAYTGAVSHQRSPVEDCLAPAPSLSSWYTTRGHGTQDEGHMADVCRRGGPPVGHATKEAPRRCASAAVARFLANKGFTSHWFGNCTSSNIETNTFLWNYKLDVYSYR